MKKILVTPGVQRNGQIVTPAHLKEVLSNFNPDAAVPITLGHPSDSQLPAFGRVTKLYLENDGSLSGDVVFNPELQKLESEGYYTGWSVGLKKGEKGFYLHHLAMCGELPPAAEIKNLADGGASEHSVEQVQFLLTDTIGDKNEMNEEEIKKLVAEQVAELTKVLTTIEARLEAFEQKQEGEQKTPEKSEEKDERGQGKTNDETEEKLENMEKMLKAERLEKLKKLLAEKGLTPEQMKPLLEAVEAGGDITLADSPYSRVLQFADSLPSLQKQGFLNLTVPKDGSEAKWKDLASKM